MLETLQQMGQGFIHALTWLNLLAMVGGVTLGIVIGCLPGLSAAMGVALMLPLTFTMPTDTGLIVLGAIYCGAIFGGSISAILIHTPGTPASAATAIEGYQMTLNGQAGKALATACWSPASALTPSTALSASCSVRRSSQKASTSPAP